VSHSTEQRRDDILAQLYETGHVAVKDLAGRMGISPATVRRDLKALSLAGQVELVYGGARLRRRADYSFRSKARRNVEAKRIVGRLAADLISDNEQMFVDSGSTCFETAAGLKQKHGLCVIVNSARLAVELDAPGLDVILLGGQYRPDRMDTSGPLAMSALAQLRGYVAFIGADGLSMEFGLTASDIESAHIYRLAITNAQESVLLVDHTKFLAPSLFKIVDWDAISRVVTDRLADAEWMEFFEARGIEVVYPEASGPAETEAGAQGRAGQPAGQEE